MQLVLLDGRYGDNHRSVHADIGIDHLLLQVVLDVPLRVKGGILVPEAVGEKRDKVSPFQAHPARRPAACPVFALLRHGVEQRIFESVDNCGRLIVVVRRPRIVQEDVQRLLHALLLADDHHVFAHEGKSYVPTPFAPNGDVSVDAIPEPLVVERLLDVLHREHPAQEGERVAAVEVRDDEGIGVVEVDTPLVKAFGIDQIGKLPLQIVQSLVAQALQVHRGEGFCVLGQQLRKRADGSRLLTATTRHSESDSDGKRKGPQRPGSKY